MDKVRLAVLGVGSWTAVNHLPAIEGRDDVEWVAAVDTIRRDAETWPLDSRSVS